VPSSHRAVVKAIETLTQKSKATRVHFPLRPIQVTASIIIITITILLKSAHRDLDFLRHINTLTYLLTYLKSDQLHSYKFMGSSCSPDSDILSLKDCKHTAPAPALQQNLKPLT